MSKVSNCEFSSMLSRITETCLGNLDLWVYVFRKLGPMSVFFILDSCFYFILMIMISDQWCYFRCFDTIFGIIILIGLVCGMLDTVSLDIIIWNFWVFCLRFYPHWFLLNFILKHVFSVDFLFTDYHRIWYFRILEGFSCWFLLDL